jgi:20S proteasome alpha/beta subunit
MTLAAAFRCNDGIIIGADSEVTYGNSKLDQDKLFVIPGPVAQGGQYGIVLTGAGDFAEIGHCAQLLKEKYFNNPDWSMDGIQRTLRAFATSKDYRESVARQTSSAGELLTEFILAVRSEDGQTELFSIRGLKYSPVQDYVAMGAGEETALFISKWLYRSGLGIRAFSPLALQVFRSSKGQNAGVGGSTKIYKLFNAGHGINEPRVSVHNDADFLWGLHDLLAKVIGCFVQTSLPDEYFEKVLNEFIAMARDIRADFIKDSLDERNKFLK